MTATIQATCPGCRHLLRIPAEWSDRAMKCKKCGTMVQVKKRPTAAVAMVETARPVSYVPAPVEAPAYVPAAVPASYPLPQYAPYPVSNEFAYPAAETAFPTSDDTATRRKYQRKSNNVLVKIVGVVGAILAALGLVFLGTKLNNAGGSANNMPVAPPSKTSEPNKTETSPKPVTPVAQRPQTDPFPRRMLFIHVAKYVYFNNLSPGVVGRGDDAASSTAEKMAFELNVPTGGPTSQLFVLSDTGPKPPAPPLKAIITQSVDQFLTTSRDQDRVLIYFGGHATVVDGKAYLVPLEGEPDNPETLIPLDDFYAKVAACKAQQKTVLFDVCRFNPGYGASKTGSAPMSEKLGELLHAVPPGVQVVSSCSPGQNAQETTESGSEFLAAFRGLARQLKRDGKVPPQTPADAIPIDKWAEALRSHLATARDSATPQTLKTTNLTRDPKTEKPYVKDEALAKRFDWPAAPTGASADEVNKLIDAANLPGIRKDLELPTGLAVIYPFSAELMKAYASDGIADDQILKEGDKYPVRKATLEALASIRKNWSFTDGGLRETLDGSADDKLKKQLADEQVPFAKLELEFREQMTALEAAGKHVVDEKSKRWVALYQYTLAQTQLRWAFLNEYNLSLGNIRTDSLEKPAGGTPVWRLTSVEKMKSKKDITSKVDEAKEALEKLAAEHKGTPWEVLAKMHKNVALGLAWKLVLTEAPAMDGEKTDEKK